MPTYGAITSSSRQKSASEEVSSAVRGPVVARGGRPLFSSPASSSDDIIPSKPEASSTTDLDTHDSDIENLRRASMSDESISSAQAGVKRLEAISTTWTKSALYIAYLGIALLAFSTSLEGQTTGNLAIYATSAFKAHSLVSTVLVVQGVVLSVVKPPMSKIADVFGRFEAFSLSVFLYIIGYIQQAASNNVNTYAAAQIFYASGQTGLQILIQIFIADTSDLVNRALCSTLPMLPYIVNVWIGPALANYFLVNLNWRWGYGIWAIILPIAFLPLALALIVSQRKAAKRGVLPKSSLAGKGVRQVVKTLWFELDFFGLVLICAAFTLILVPLTLASKSSWTNPDIAAMLAVGTACLIAIPYWERNKRLAPRAFFPRSFWRNKTLLAGLALSFFYFMAFYLSVYPYYQSYLLVVQNMSVTSAGQTVQTFTFTSTITSILLSLAIKHTKQYKIFMLIGTSLYTTGLILMLFLRVQNASLFTTISTQVFLGVGGALTHVPAQLGVQASASHSEVAAATALFLTFLEIGGAVGSAISGAIWSAQIPAKLEAYLPEETKGLAGEIFGNVSLAASGWEMGTPTREAINLAYQETMTQIVGVAVVASLPCIVLAWWMKGYKLDEIDQGVTGVVIGGGAPPAPAVVSESIAGFEDAALLYQSDGVVSAGGGRGSGRGLSMRIEGDTTDDDDDDLEDEEDEGGAAGRERRRNSRTPLTRTRTASRESHRLKSMDSRHTLRSERSRATLRRWREEDEEEENAGLADSRTRLL